MKDSSTILLTKEMYDAPCQAGDKLTADLTVVSHDASGTRVTPSNIQPADQEEAVEPADTGSGASDMPDAVSSMGGGKY